MLIFNWANEPTKSENCLGPFRCPDSNLSYEGQADVQLMYLLLFGQLSPRKKKSFKQVHDGPLHSQLESLSDSWARLKHSRDWLCNSSYSFESDFDLTKSLGIHTLIENVVSFVSGDVGNAPGFKEPEESMSTSPQASIIAMEQQQLRAELRLEALHQILVLLSGMEEKGSISVAGSRSSSGFQSSTAHICEAAVSSRVFWFRHCGTCRSQRREWPIASLSGWDQSG